MEVIDGMTRFLQSPPKGEELDWRFEASYQPLAFNSLGHVPHTYVTLVYLSFYISWLFPPVWGVTNNKKNWGFTPFF